ncbi:hypothetical protein N9W89_09175 [Hellea sp.]|nr:hypothetical protein [Hellea sp.]
MTKAKKSKNLNFNQKMDCEVTKKILKASRSAFELYYEMSDGECWVKQTPEYWYTTSIAKTLHRHYKKYYNKLEKSAYVLLENSVSDIRSHSNTTKRGRPHHDLRSAGRADISIWIEEPDQWWYPVSVIEVKTRGESVSTFKADVNRIKRLLREAGKKSGLGTVENGYYVVITDIGNVSDKRSAKTKLKARHNKLHAKIQQHVGKGITVGSNFKLCGYKKDETSRAAIFVFKFEIKN